MLSFQGDRRLKCLLKLPIASELLFYLDRLDLILIKLDVKAVINEICYVWASSSAAWAA